MNMRTIKFRGKNLYNNEWIFGDLIQYESGEMAIFQQETFPNMDTKLLKCLIEVRSFPKP